MDTVTPRSSTTNAKTSPVTADTNPSPKLRTGSTTKAKTSSVTAKASPSPKLRSDATNAKPSAPNTGSIASPNTKVPAPGAPKPGPRSDAIKQMGAAELDVIHQKAIQSIDGAGKAMSVARETVEKAKSSKTDRNQVVAKANMVVGALLVPSRHVIRLLSRLGALFPPCKQVSNTLAALIKHEITRQEKDVRVAIVHFDLARALVHIGSLNRKSRPLKSIADPLDKSLKDFKGLIQEFSVFCEAYYETRAPESALKHLRLWKKNKDSLNSFADRIAQLKKDLTSLLSQQAVQHPGKHAEVLAQIESRLTENRAFYTTIRDANEEIAEAFLSKQLKQGGEASVRLVQDGRLLKQLAGTVGEGVTHGISNAIKKTTATTLKQVQEQVAKTLPPADAKPTSKKTTFASKLQGTLGKLVSGEKQKDAKSGPHSPHERVQKSAPTTTHAPARGQQTGHQQKKRSSEASGKYQTPDVQVQPFPDSVNTVAEPEPQGNMYRGVTDDQGNPTKGSVRAAEQPGGGEETFEPELVQISLGVEDYEYADREVERDDNDDQEFRYPQEGEETGNGLGVDGEDKDEDGDSYPPGADYEDRELDDSEYALGEPGDDEYGQEAYYLQEGGDDVDVDIDGDDDVNVDIDGGDDVDVDVDGGDDVDYDVDGGDNVDYDVDADGDGFGLEDLLDDGDGFGLGDLLDDGDGGILSGIISTVIDSL